MKKAKLIPPDLKQCQAEKPNGNSFMTFGGVPGYVRCTEKPTVIAYENEPSQKDGQKGSMSLCEACCAVMLKQLGPDYCTIKPIVHLPKVTVYHGTSVDGLKGAIRTRKHRHVTKPCFCTSLDFKAAALFAMRKVTLEEMKEGKAGLVYEFEFSGKPAEMQSVKDAVLQEEKEVAIFNPRKLKVVAIHHYENGNWIRKEK